MRILLTVLFHAFFFYSGSQTINTVCISNENAYEVFAIETVDSVIVVTWMEDRDSTPFSTFALNKQVAVSVSNDNGLTWSNKIVFDDTSYSTCGNSTLFSDNFGNIYILYMAVDFTIPYVYGKLVLHKSEDNGTSWTYLSEPINYPSESKKVADFPHMVVKNDTIDIVYTEYDSLYIGRIKQLKSTNGGITWNPPVLVSDTSAIYCIGSYLTSCKNNIELLSWYQFNMNPELHSHAILFAENSNSNFNIADIIYSSSFGNVCVTEMICSDNSSKIGILFYRVHDIGEVYYIGSNDFGTTWKSPVLITINGSMASGTFDDFDNLHITYAELLPDDSLNYFTIVSNNNGVTFSSPIKLVNTSYLESINKYFGAYCSTIHGGDDQIHAFWIDWRNNDFYLQHSFWSAQYNAITEEDYPFYLQIFPNPVTEFVIIKSSSALKRIQIFNLFGQQLADYKNPGRSSNLDISNFQSGSYLIKVHTMDNKIISQKIIKLP